MKRFYKLLLGIAGITATAVWSVHGVDFGLVAESLGAMHYTLLAAVLLLTTLNLVVRAAVWRNIVHPLKNCSLYEAFTSYLLGVFSNLFLPLKLGDVVQGYGFSRREGINPISAVSAVMVQRIAEVATLLLVMAVISFVFSFPLLFKQNTVILTLIVAGCLAALFGLYALRRSVDAACERVLSRIAPRIAEAVRGFLRNVLDGTGALRDLPYGLKIIGLSLLSWVLQIAMVAVTARSLDIHLDIIASSAVLLIINLGLGIPIAPGNIGTFQFFGIIALSFFSIGKTEALTFSIVFQAIQGVPVIIGGGLSALRYVVQTKRTAKSVSTDAHPHAPTLAGRDELP